MKPYPTLQRRIRIALCAALAFATGAAAAQTAQTTTAASSQTMPSPAASSSAPMQQPQKTVYDTRKRTLVVKSSVPAQRDYGPAPDFKKLDSNHDGRLTSSEASAYPPLANDFLYASHGAKTLNRREYRHWVNTP